MAVNNAALTSTTNVWAYMGLPTATDTSLFETLINASSSFVEELLGRKLKSRTYTDFRIDGNGETWLLYPEYPLTSVSALVIEDSQQQTIVTIDTDLSNKKMLIERDVGKVILMEEAFVSGTQNIKTTFIAGYIGSDTNDKAILDLLDLAVTIMVQHLYLQRGKVDQTIVEEKIGDYEYKRKINSAFGALPESLAQAVLNLKRV
jgi:hypothetical protein